MADCPICSHPINPSRPAEIASLLDRPALKEAKRFFAKNRISRATYPREIIDAFDDAKSAIEGHASEIKRIQRLIDWDDGTRFASTNIKKAQKEINQAQSDLQKLEDEKRNEVERAQYAEKQAAQRWGRGR